MFLKSWELDLELSAAQQPAWGGCGENQALEGSCLHTDLWGTQQRKELCWDGRNSASKDSPHPIDYHGKAGCQLRGRGTRGSW